MWVATRSGSVAPRSRSMSRAASARAMPPPPPSRVPRRNRAMCKSPVIPNAIAALLLHIRDATGKMPHAYFGWTEGNPITYVLRYLFLGEGDTAPVTREVLRRAISNPLERPRIHVG